MNIETMTHLKISKYLSVKEARSFANKIKPELGADQPCVIVDLSAVEQIDAAGLDLLLRCMLQVAKRDGSVRLAGISPQAATVLELTRMDRVFAMFPETSEEVPCFEAQPVEQTIDESARQHSAA